MFFLPVRHEFVLQHLFVADPPLRRNNSMKIHRNSLESAENRLTFASSKVEVSFLFHIML